MADTLTELFESEKILNKERKLGINWLLEVGQNISDQQILGKEEQNTRYLYQMIQSRIVPSTREFSDRPNEVPYEVQEAFRFPFLHDKIESFRAIKEWPPKPTLNLKNHQMIGFIHASFLHLVRV